MGRLILIAGATVAVGLVACRGDGSKEVSIEDLPKCSDVWVAGKTLPADYEGCTENDDIATSLIIECVGDDKFTTYDGFHAFLGGTIAKGGPPNSQEYLGALSACTQGG